MSLPPKNLLAFLLIVGLLFACASPRSPYEETFRKAKKAANPYLCGPLPDREEFACIYRLAAKYDLSSCEAAGELTLDSKWGVAGGDDLCYFAVALQEHRPEACDLINAPLKDEATGGLSSVSRERCIANVAAAFNEPSRCPQLRGEDETHRRILEICLQQRTEPGKTVPKAPP